MSVNKKIPVLIVVLIFLLICAPLTVFAETEGDWEYYTDTASAIITSYNGTETSITIPSKLGGLPVKTIDGHIFLNSADITKIVIPNSVAEIGDGAFYGCSSLGSIVIPNSVTKIDSGAFAYCTSMTNITLPNNLKVINIFTFDNCTSLKSITIPASVIEIDWHAFNNCTNLKDIIFNGNAPNIAVGAFDGISEFKIYYYEGAKGFDELKQTLHVETVMLMRQQSGNSSPAITFLIPEPIPVYTTETQTGEDNKKEIIYDNPKTGDNTQIGLIIVLITACVVGIIYSFIKIRRLK